MKTMRKLLPAIAMLLVSVVLMSTASFAWFSMNKKVEISGMAVNATVSSNLLISKTTDEAGFVVSETQTRTGMLEPVSTVDGENFFYTLNAKANGDAITEDYKTYNEDTERDNSNAGKTKYDATFNTDYGFTSPATGTVAYGYIDYTFYLKAITTEAGQKLTMDVCNLLYDNRAIPSEGEKAMRVALFATDACPDAPTADGETLKLKTILALDGAVNQTERQAVSGTRDLGAVTKYKEDAVVCSDIDGEANTGVTRYFKVVVRLYLEGEDTTCTNSTFLDLKESWALNVGFKIDASDSADGVNKISSTAP